MYVPPKLGRIFKTLIQVLDGVYDSWNFEQISIKTAWNKNIFDLHLIPNKMYEIYIMIYTYVGIYQRNVVLGNFSIKNKSTHLLVVEVLFIQACKGTYSVWLQGDQ